MITLLFLLFLLVGVDLSQAQTGPCPNGAPLAFEGAEGFGRCAQGGRGGRVIEVTNLNDSGPGSLRQCAQVESGPRICVFSVAGTITLLPPGATTADILITNDFLTIDGASAPQGGIALKDGGLSVMASHVIVRHLRVRPGMKSAIERGSNANGITVMSNGSVRTTDVIIDHCSVSWTSDDAVSVIYGADRITFQWNLISDSISHTGDPRGKHFLMGYQARSVSFHHNLGAHGFMRWPEYSGGGPSEGGQGQLDFVNNLNYNGNGTDTLVDPHHGPSFANFVGNYWQQGLDSVPANDYPSIKLYHALPYSAQSGVYVANNYGRYWAGSGTLATGVASPDTAIINHEGSGGIAVSQARYPYPQITTTDPATARTQILANVGAFPRDSYDTRIIAEVTNGTGHRITNSATQVGPWPVLTSGTTTPPPPPAAPYSLSAPASTAPGAMIAVQWVAPSGHSTSDWIAFAPVGSGPNGYMTWAYVPAGTSGTVNIPAPSTAGNYELRYLLNNGYEQAAITTIIVGSAPPPPPPPAKQCADGVDNDSDGKIDLVDPGCADANDDSESPDPLTIEQRVAALEQALGTTQATLLALGDAQTALILRADTHDTRLNNHDASYASLASQLAALGGVVSTLQAQITDLTALLGTTNQTVSTHTASITSLQASVTAIQSKLTAMCQALGGCL